MFGLATRKSQDAMRHREGPGKHSVEVEGHVAELVRETW